MNSQSRQWIGDPPSSNIRCSVSSVPVKQGLIKTIRGSTTTNGQRLSTLQLTTDSQLSYILGQLSPSSQQSQKSNQLSEEKLGEDEFIVGCYGYLNR